MTLLRPCGRLVQAFDKLTVSCQVSYIQGVERVARTEGYVTVAPKLGNSISNSEKLEVPSSNLNASDITSRSLAANLKRRLDSLYYSVKHGRIHSLEILPTLESCMSSDGRIIFSNGLAVLHCCQKMLLYTNPANKQIITSRVWELLCRDSFGLTLKHYNAILDIYIQNNQPVEPKIFLNDMIVKPDSTTYKLLLTSAAKCGNVESTLYMLEKIKNVGLSLNEEMFNLLILAHGINKDIKSALSVVDTMKNARIEPSVKTYISIACAYVCVADIHNTMKILNAYPLNLPQIMKIVKLLSSSNLGRHIPDALKYLPLPLNAIDELFVNTIIKLTHNGRPEDAFEVVNCLTPTVSTDAMNPIFNIFLKTIVQAKIPSSIILKFMNMIMTVKNYPRAASYICHIALRTGDSELAMAVFEVMHERKIEVRPHYYWPLLIQAPQSYHDIGIFRILRHMLSLNVALNYDTLNRYVLPYIETINPFTTLQKFGDLGLKISKVFTPLICYLLHQGRIKEAVSLCSRIKEPIDFDKVFGCLVFAYERSKNINDCVKMFKFAPPKKYYPEKFIFILCGMSLGEQNALLLNKFLQAFEALEIPVLSFMTVEAEEIDEADGRSEVTLVNPLDSVRPSNRVPDLKDMNLEELKCLLIKCKTKEMCTANVLRKRLQFHCKQNNVNRVEEIKIEYDKNRFFWTPAMYFTLLQLYVRNGRVEEAMTLYSKIKDYKYFKIDNTIIHLATALVNTNMIREAFTILKSTTMTVDPRISKNCWHLLDAVAHSSNYELTESMLEVLVNAGFCVRNNAMMGPLVRVHLLRDDLASAVDTFVKCAKRYLHAPLHQELVFALVKSMNTNKSAKDEMIKLLTEVQSIITEIHGRHNARMDLLVALAQLGMTDKLRKFLQNNIISNHIPSIKLAFLTENDKLLTLTTLLEASKGILKINRSVIYEQILSVHSSSGDCEKAIELWKRFSAENDDVPRAFRTALVSLLTEHNVPLPETLSNTRVDE